MENGATVDLAICIPTCNRSRLLRGCLENIIEVAGRYSVRICVSDNASTDDTERVVAEMKAAYEHIHYRRNNENVGIANFGLALTMSKSRYSWLFSDDERIAPGALERVAASIAGGEHDMVVVNGGGYLKPAVDRGKIRVRDIGSRVYRDRNELLSDLGWHMTWMSCLIYGRKMLGNIDFDRYRTSPFLQTEVVFAYLAHGDISVYWESFPCIYTVQEGESAWNPLAFEIWAEWWPNAVACLPNAYSWESKVKCIRDHGIKSGVFRLPYVLYLRAFGHYDIGKFRRYRMSFPILTELPTGLLLIASILPPALLRAAVRVYRRVKSIRMLSR